MCRGLPPGGVQAPPCVGPLAGVVHSRRTGTCRRAAAPAAVQGMERALLFYRDELQLGRKQETPAAPPRSTAATRRALLL